LTKAAETGIIETEGKCLTTIQKLISSIGIVLTLPRVVWRMLLENSMKAFSTPWPLKKITKDAIKNFAYRPKQTLPGEPEYLR
jgi:hypothetical protein